MHQPTHPSTLYDTVTGEQRRLLARRAEEHLVAQRRRERIAEAARPAGPARPATPVPRGPGARPGTRGRRGRR